MMHTDLVIWHFYPNRSFWLIVKMFCFYFCWIIFRFEENQSRKKKKGEKTSSSAVGETSGSNIASTSKSKHEVFDVFNASTDEESSKDSESPSKKPTAESSNGKPNSTSQELDEDGFPILPDFFSGKTFLLYGKLKDRRTMFRYITAYNGSVCSCV